MESLRNPTTSGATIRPFTYVLHPQQLSEPSLSSQNPITNPILSPPKTAPATHASSSSPSQPSASGWASNTKQPQ